ncbi:hypothetical protein YASMINEVIRUS_717 [Yasminevirus sp. GU-2018]|uniref:Uncharacterized protein n=1 Tax=Yasminevirus sp. GU-2018 TaxID=2420051 RepID=A0A5K0U9V6_9VIRU|nr:hypothetical protein YASMINEVIRUS_717 [Yasminevirus sp. GU-2018]
MSLNDILTRVVGFFVNLILKPLAPVLDFIFTRMIIVATSPLATKRFYNLGVQIAEYATSDEHKDETFSAINKVVCAVPEYLNDCEAQDCLKKMGPSLVKLPRLVLADKENVLNEGCELTVFGIQYLDSFFTYLLGSAEGLVCVMKITCAIQNTGNTIVSLLTGKPTDATPGITLIKLFKNNIGWALVSHTLKLNADVRKDFIKMISNPCDTKLKDTIECFLRQSYLTAYDETINYDNTTTGGVPNEIPDQESDKDSYLKFYGDACVYSKFVEYVTELNAVSPNAGTVATFDRFMGGNPDLRYFAKC